MLTADPRVVESPRLVPYLSFAEAAELAYFGAKVLRPKSIQPAAAPHIPVRILNTFKPQAPGTLIADGAAPEPSPVTALACKQGITVVTITSTGMLMAYGYLRRLFEVFERYRSARGCGVDLGGQRLGDHRRPHAPGRHRRGGSRLFAEVTVSHHLALVAVVGDRYGADPLAFSRVVKALQGLPLRLVSQADARRNVTLVLDQDNLAAAMSHLHAEFFHPAVPTPATLMTSATSAS